MYFSERIRPCIPRTLIAFVLATLLVTPFGLPQHSVVILDLLHQGMSAISVSTVSTEELRELQARKTRAFLGHHFIPVVLGPKGHNRIIDYHNLARTLHAEGVKDVLVTILADWSKLDKEAFHVVLYNRA